MLTFLEQFLGLLKEFPMEISLKDSHWIPGTYLGVQLYFISIFEMLILLVYSLILL